MKIFHVMKLNLFLFSDALLKSLDESKSLLADIQALTKRKQPQVKKIITFFNFPLFIIFNQ